MVECTGIEPVVPKAPDLQSSASPLMLPLQIGDGPLSCIKAYQPPSGSFFSTVRQAQAPAWLVMDVAPCPRNAA